MAALQDRRFDPALLDQILDRTPLASLIGANVALKKSGKAQAGCCPFHGERTPSFNVYEKHFHCLSRETRVVTWDGIAEIGSLAGTDQRLLTRGGAWVDAPIRSFGVQRLWEVSLSRNSVRKKIYATGGHRWFVNGLKGEVLTSGLRLGHSLESVFPKQEDLSLAREGVQHGIVFGDGTTENGNEKTVVCLHGDKANDLAPWFEGERQYVAYLGNGKPYLRVRGLAKHLKRLPALTEPSDYLAGFLAGYLATDGHVAADGTVSLHCCNPEVLEAVRSMATRIGLGTHGVTTQMQVGYGSSPSAIHRIHFVTAHVPAAMILRPGATARLANASKAFGRHRWSVQEVRETDRVEEVYCAQVAGTAAFALEDNILTGNCFGCGEHGNAFDYVRKNEGVSFPEAVKRLAADAGVDLPQGISRPTTPADRAAQEAAAQDRQRRIEAKFIADAREKDAREEAIAKQAERRWAKGTPAPADHPYLARKEISPDGLRVDAKGNLLVPMRDEEGKLWNLQTIPKKGKKMTLWRRTADGAEGGRAQGLSDALGSLDGARAVVVAEGRATGASVHEATGLPVRVAFSSGNLEHVVRSLRERHPDLPIIVAADNDHHKERLTPPKENVGMVKAEKAVKNVPHAAVLAPPFEASSTGTDWNDYRAQHGAAPIKALFDAKLLSITTPKQEAPMAVQPTPATSTTPPAPEPAAPTPPPAIPATVAELVAELGRQAAGNAKAEKYIAGLAEEIRNRPEVEVDPKFLKRVLNTTQSLERDGASIPMTQELRDLVAEKTAAPAVSSATTQPSSEPAGTTQVSARQNAQGAQQAPAASAGQATAQPQRRNRAIGALGSAMSQLYAALRPPAPTNPPPWEQAPQPLGDRLAAFERRATENAITTQTQAAQLAGERAQAALEKLGTGPGGAILGKIKETAQNEPGGMPAVVAEMAPGGRFADLRTAFNATLVQERAFASAYDRAVSGITEYGGARMKLSDTLGKRQMDVTAIDGRFEDMDRTIGQASEALPGRKDGKSIQDELAEKAARLAEFLKNMVQRIGNAIRPTAAPAEAAIPMPAAAPARAPAMAPSP